MMIGGALVPAGAVQDPDSGGWIGPVSTYPAQPAILSALKVSHTLPYFLKYKFGGSTITETTPTTLAFGWNALTRSVAGYGKFTFFVYGT